MQVSKEDIIISVTIVTLVLLLLVIFIVAFLFLYQRKQYRYRQEKRDMEDAFKREILQAQMEIQEQTFEAVSHEIHDNVGQVLSVARIYINTLKECMPGQDSECRHKIDQVHELVGKAIQDLRQISKSINTDFIERSGLPESLRFELERIRKSGVFKTEFVMNGSTPDFNKEQSIILFRICQELFANVIRHSGATTISVEVKGGPGPCYIKIQDNGKGFSQENSEGTGIGNIKKRAGLIDADILIDSHAGHGTSVTINMTKR